MAPLFLHKANSQKDLEGTEAAINTAQQRTARHLRTNSTMPSGKRKALNTLWINQSTDRHWLRGRAQIFRHQNNKSRTFKAASYIYINRHIYYTETRYFKKKKITFIQPSKILVFQERPTFPIRGRCSVLFLKLITLSFIYSFSMYSEKIKDF